LKPFLSVTTCEEVAVQIAELPPQVHLTAVFGFVVQAVNDPSGNVPIAVERRDGAVQSFCRNTVQQVEHVPKLDLKK